MELSCCHDQDKKVIGASFACPGGGFVVAGVPAGTGPGGGSRRRALEPCGGVLIGLNGGGLDAVVGTRPCEHATCDERGWAIAVDGKDLHGSWSDDGRLAPRVLAAQQAVTAGTRVGICRLA